MGDGTTITCGQGKPWRSIWVHNEPSPDCGHMYSKDGEYTITATSHWVVNWSGIGQSGTITTQLSDTATLRIANAEAADAGTYRCTVNGASETLACRPRQLWVHAAPQLAQWNFNGNATDSVGTLHGTAFGTPVEAVTPAKVIRLRRLTAGWLAEHQVRPAAVRLDVIGILWPRGGKPELVHLSGVDL